MSSESFLFSTKNMNLLSVFLFIALISVSIACKCRPLELDQYYCHSDYMIRAMITTDKQDSDDEDMGRHMVSYGFKVVQVYKDKHNLMNDTTKEYKVLTSESSASCGRYLTKDETYILSGSVTESKMKTSSCDFGRTIEELDDNQKSFFDQKKYESIKCQDVKEQ